MEMRSKVWRWVLGLTYIVAVAIIWIAASFVVQSVVDAGVSPFLITYICNSLFVVYIPIVETGRWVEDKYGSLLFWRKGNAGGGGRRSDPLHEPGESEKAILLGEGSFVSKDDGLYQQSKLIEEGEISRHGQDESPELESSPDGRTSFDETVHKDDGDKQVDEKGRWTRMRVAKASLVVCPFWFLAQLTFNLSLKYTTVTSNTILSSASSLFTFLVALVFLGEKFTWVKLISVILCMGGTIIVSLGDSETTLKAIATNPLLGDILALVSSALYAVYITLIRVKLPDDEEKQEQASMAEFLGYLGLFNLLIFLPVALVLDFTKLEPFDNLTWQQFGLIVGKGLLDNVLSDFLWAKAVLLTTTTVATAGLTIQVPLAAVIDTITGNAPHLLDYLGAVAVMIGFAGINIPSDVFCKSKEPGAIILENEPAEEKDEALGKKSSVVVS
ncbi:hypothetical protein MLD38_032936 [Melastoma candidum]|uniref:Uncharacterized protein n=1 Tax=Melastoma candidum TaxID=119954 RepID=A0ACB9M5K5_9MYRT|nr:hypothetical protein MLD38_032936 [Melastoma candidum]